jgi:hypothetical protein
MDPLDRIQASVAQPCTKALAAYATGRKEKVNDSVPELLEPCQVGQRHWFTIGFGGHVSLVAPGSGTDSIKQPHEWQFRADLDDDVAPIVSSSP